MDETKGSFGRKYADCAPLEGDGGQFDASTPPDWLDPDSESSAEDSNLTTAWDETGNFTGMDEYWAGTRDYEEGEEVPWWRDAYPTDEGEFYREYDDGNCAPI